MGVTSTIDVMSRPILRDDLGGIGGGLARAAEVALAGAGPGDDLAFVVGDGNNGIVERSQDVDEAGGDVLRALGLADLDGAKLFLEQVFGGGLLGNAANHLDRSRRSDSLDGHGGLFGRSLGGFFPGRLFRSGGFGFGGGCGVLLRSLFFLGS
jgi:hypothetical protein